MFVIGIVLKPQGIRGEVKVEPLTPDAGRFKKLNSVFIDQSVDRTYDLERVSVRGKFVYLKFAGFDDRNEAEKLRGCEICIAKEDVISLPDDTYFIHDLVGCRVETEEGKLIGEVTGIMQSGANDVYEIHDERGQEYLIPGIHDVVKKIDIENNKLVIHVIDGLLE